MNTGKTLLSGKEFSKEQLNEALRAIWDLMEFYIWHPTLETAKSIREGQIQGSKITAVIQKRHLTKEVKSAIKAQLDYWQDRGISEPYTFDDQWIKWTYNGVPIEFKILKQRYNFFERPDARWYMNDDYHLANPFDKYWKARFIVK